MPNTGSFVRPLVISRLFLDFYGTKTVSFPSHPGKDSFPALLGTEGNPPDQVTVGRVTGLRLKFISSQNSSALT